MSRVCVPSLHTASPTDETLDLNEVCEIGKPHTTKRKSSRRKENEAGFSDRLLTDRDVAARYKVEKQTIWRWARTSNRFPKPFKIEGTARWSENELDDHDRKLKEAR